MVKDVQVHRLHKWKCSTSWGEEKCFGQGRGRVTENSEAECRGVEKWVTWMAGCQRVRSGV